MALQKSPRAISGSISQSGTDIDAVAAIATGINASSLFVWHIIQVEFEIVNWPVYGGANGRAVAGLSKAETTPLSLSDPDCICTVSREQSLVGAATSSVVQGPGVWIAPWNFLFAEDVIYARFSTSGAGAAVSLSYRIWFTSLGVEPEEFLEIRRMP